MSNITDIILHQIKHIQRKPQETFSFIHKTKIWTDEHFNNCNNYEEILLQILIYGFEGVINVIND